MWSGCCLPVQPGSWPWSGFTIEITLNSSYSQDLLLDIVPSGNTRTYSSSLLPAIRRLELLELELSSEPSPPAPPRREMSWTTKEMTSSYTRPRPGSTLVVAPRLVLEFYLLQVVEWPPLQCKLGASGLPRTYSLAL